MGTGRTRMSDNESIPAFPSTPPNRPWDATKLINPAVAAFDLARMRAGRFTQLIQSVRCYVHGSLSRYDDLAVMQTISHLVRRYPSIWFELPSAWHYMPDT